MSCWSVRRRTSERRRDRCGRSVHMARRSAGNGAPTPTASPPGVRPAGPCRSGPVPASPPWRPSAAKATRIDRSNREPRPDPGHRGRDPGHRRARRARVGSVAARHDRDQRAGRARRLPRARRHPHFRPEVRPVRVVRPRVPPPGVYTYSADGQEEVKLGPLPTETRPLPDTVTVVVVDHGDGCFEWTINLFAEHTEDTRYCSSPVRRAHADGSRHAPAARRPVTHRNGGLRPRHPHRTRNPHLDVDLRHDHGRRSGGHLRDARRHGDARTDRAGHSWRRAGRSHAVDRPVRGHRRSHGTWNETLWLRDDLLPVRIERDLDLTGPATFSERSRLELADLSPAT